MLSGRSKRFARLKLKYFSAPSSLLSTSRLLILPIAAMTLLAVALAAGNTLRASRLGPMIPDRAAAAVFSTSRFPIYSYLFKGKDNPFHTPVSELIGKGAKRRPNIEVDNLFRQGLAEGNPGAGGSALYVTTNADPAYVFRCKYYSAKGCNADAQILHVPPGAIVQQSSDHHVIVADLALGGEVDGWGGGSGVGADGQPAGQCNVAARTVSCSWAGFYPFTGKGLDNTGNSSINAGYAMGLFVITAQELLNKQISHALGLNTVCLDDPATYPADTSKGTDASCVKNGRDSPAPHYGALLHLKWSAAQISASKYSEPCKTILTALATYGAYTYDTGNNGLALAIENGSAYPSPNPYFSAIYPEMVADGDGNGIGADFRWRSCLNRLDPDDFELYHIPKLGY